MITIIEHGNEKRYPQFCKRCRCIFEVQVNDTVPLYVVETGERQILVKCPECNNYMKCENMKGEEDNGGE